MPWGIGETVTFQERAAYAPTCPNRAKAGQKQAKAAKNSPETVTGSHRCENYKTETIQPKRAVSCPTLTKWANGATRPTWRNPGHFLTYSSTGVPARMGSEASNSSEPGRL